MTLVTVTVTPAVRDAAMRVRSCEDALLATTHKLHEAWADRNAALLAAGYTIAYEHITHGVAPSLRMVVLNQDGHTIDLDTIAP